MKTLFTLFIAASLAGAMQAQTLSFVASDTAQIGWAHPDSAFYELGDILNNSSKNFDVDVVAVQQNLAPNWMFSFCVDVCWPPGVDSARYYSPANSQQAFVMDWYPSTVPSSSSVQFKYKEVTDPSNVIYVWFYGSTLALSVDNLLAENLRLKIFPSPAISGIPFQADIAGTKSGDTYELVFYSAHGSIVSQGRLQEGSNNILLNHAPGLYTYSLLKNKVPLFSGKIPVL